MTEGLIQLLGGYGPLGILAGLYVVTVIFGQFISSTTTAALFVPIANAALTPNVELGRFLL